MSRLIIVSTRLPYFMDRKGDLPVLRQNSGGLVSALKSYFEKENVEIKKSMDCMQSLRKNKKVIKIIFLN